MPTIYDLKPAFQRLLAPLVHGLARAGVTANAVTVAALVPLTASTLPPGQQYGIPDYGKSGHP